MRKEEGGGLKEERGVVVMEVDPTINKPTDKNQPHNPKIEHFQQQKPEKSHKIEMIGQLVSVLEVI